MDAKCNTCGGTKKIFGNLPKTHPAYRKLLPCPVCCPDEFAVAKKQYGINGTSAKKEQPKTVEKTIEVGEDMPVVVQFENTGLNLDKEGKTKLSINDLIGQRIAVLGISGSGKSNTAAVLLEETLNEIPTTIIDPENEYAVGLRGVYPILVVGQTKYADIDIPIEQAQEFGRLVWQRRLSVILALNYTDTDEELSFSELSYLIRMFYN